MARLFLAVWPPVEVAGALAALPREEQPGVRYTAPQSWHVTMRFFGTAEPDDVEHALAGVELPPAIARVGPSVRRITKGVLAVPVEGLSELATAVAARTTGIGAPPSASFIGHITLARVKPAAGLPELLGTSVDAEFDVGEIALVESRLDHKGARYETLATWSVG